jgi:hypothetical protein
MRNSMPDARGPETSAENGAGKIRNGYLQGILRPRFLCPPYQPVRDCDKWMAGIIEDLDIIEAF